MAGIGGFVALDNVIMAALDAASLRQRVAADNMANANTPGFRRHTVHFEEELQRSLHRRDVVGRRTNPAHLPIGGRSFARVQAEVAQDMTTVMRNDGNNVDPDREMALLTAAELQYTALTQLASARYSMLRSVITQGGR